MTSGDKSSQEPGYLSLYGRTGETNEASAGTFGGSVLADPMGSSESLTSVSSSIQQARANSLTKARLLMHQGGRQDTTTAFGFEFKEYTKSVTGPIKSLTYSTVWESLHSIHGRPIKSLTYNTVWESRHSIHG